MSFVQSLARVVDRLLAGVSHVAAWLAVPVVLALFLQWPLRDLLRCCSREANDLGQWLFALYIAVAVVAATRAGTHLASNALSRRFGAAQRRRLSIAGALAIALPFSITLLVISWGPIVESIRRFETFGDTGNPGYFVVKAAVILLAVLMALQAFVDAFQGRDRGAGE